MKKLFLTVSLFVISFSSLPLHTIAQEQEIAQLVLNLEKLNQLRKILKQLYDGYKIISEGYNKVKAITSGNYKINEVFLDGLYKVNPSVKKYHRIADIIRDQAAILRESKTALKDFSSFNIFTSGQMEYIDGVYDRLIDDSMKNLDELLMIITAGQLRMSDDERLKGIDRVYDEVQKKLLFLRSFNNRQKMIAAEILRDKVADQTLESLHGLK
ncbi:TerB family tellurite resistance protein [Niabella sp.]|uniref:TerB family tellurite resistance protein n=1 Tax=Niabella sp. TaxID=1962976 RepID=UPI002612AB32|nr:TerB family tellurite resistance protein [Niabella sp.]